MAKAEIQLKKTDSILDEITRLQSEISRRAYDFFCTHQGLFPGPLADWFRAERELVWSPAIELRQKDGVFELEASIAGVEPKDLDVQVTPQDILIKGTTQHQHETKAEHRNGLLRLTATIAKTAPTKVDIKAA